MIWQEVEKIWKCSQASSTVLFLQHHEHDAVYGCILDYVVKWGGYPIGILLEAVTDGSGSHGTPPRVWNLESDGRSHWARYGFGVSFHIRTWETSMICFTFGSVVEDAWAVNQCKSWIFKTGWLWRCIGDACSFQYFIHDFLISSQAWEDCFQLDIQGSKGSFFLTPTNRDRGNALIVIGWVDWDRMQKV